MNNTLLNVWKNGKGQTFWIAMEILWKRYIVSFYHL